MTSSLFSTLPHAQWLLIGLIAGLFLLDSACLLYHNGLVMLGTRAGWRIPPSAHALRLGGKKLFVHAPLRLHQPAFYLHWNTCGTLGPAAPWNCDAALRVIRQLGCVAWGMALFILLFCVALARDDINTMAGALVGCYTLTLLAVIRVWLARACLELSRTQVLSLGFELLCCPPFGPNLARRLSLRLSPPGDGLEQVARCLSPAEWNRLLPDLLAIQQELLDFSAADCTTLPAMRAFHAFLQKEWQSCQPLRS